MPIRVVRDGFVSLPESIRAMFELLPGDPLIYNVQGRELVLTRATAPKSESSPRRSSPGQVLPWCDPKQEAPSSE